MNNGDQSKNDLIEKLKPGDVIVTSKRGINLGAMPIRFANFSRHGYRKRIWTHAAFYIGNGEVVEAFPKGITKRDLKTAYLEQHFDIVCLRRKGMKVSDFQNAAEFCKSKVGVKYDTKALAYYVILNLLPPIFHFLLTSRWFNNLINSPDAFYCSELVGTAYLRQGAYCFDRKPAQVMPVDFYNKYCFEVIASNCDLEKKDPWFKKVIFGTGYVIGIIAWFTITLIASFIFCTVLVRLSEKIFKKQPKQSKEIADGQ
ncbi:MAG: hypothetical protein HYS55_06655 [Candidatus Omnitrophica bacterium]|nr:hypothetical protein [Candidatus Omnitrophota bacterium]